MKKKLLILNLGVIIALFSLFFISCNDDDDVQPDPDPAGEMDIVATAQSDDDFSILIEALSSAGLVTTLQGDGPFTVFAPTNAAFEQFLADNGFSSLGEVPSDLLTNVLLNHVVADEVLSNQLSEGYITTLAEASTDDPINVFVDLSDGVILNGSSTVTTADLEATNGVIHVIDEVISIPSVITHAVVNDNFEVLVSALTREDLTTDFVSVLSGDGPFTIFAPTNDAFVALLDSNDEWNDLADIPVATLEAVLTYHVVAGANVRSASLSDSQVVTTLSEDTFTVNISGSNVTITDENGRTANIVAVDVQGGNGVIHVIDQVILPQ